MQQRKTVTVEYFTDVKIKYSTYRIYRIKIYIPSHIKWKLLLTLLLTKPTSSVSHSQRLSINPYPEPNQTSSIDYCFYRYILIFSSYIRLGIVRGLFFVGLPVVILKPLLPLPIRAISSAHFNIPDFIIPTILGEQYKLRSSSSLHFHLEYSSGTCSQNPLACVPSSRKGLFFYSHTVKQVMLFMFFFIIENNTLTEKCLDRITTWIPCFASKAFSS